ncbi:MAG: DUF262 domain-containing HNH endonuclease family protein [Sandaracinaceae bacterium]|nr:DUF262 domain-containing HNH endonuclease family protein [Sandaracinaceae bacterium]
MKNQRQTIRKIVSCLNNEEEEGGFWLPNIQRPFVWSEDQICRLFDSIMREYPISTLLVWKTRSGIRRRKFIENWNWHAAENLSQFSVPENDRKKCLVLDGQQRLQSLFIGLKGSYEGKELYFDVLSGDDAAPEDIEFRFQFLDGPKAAFPWIKLKALVEERGKPRSQLRDWIVQQAQRELTEAERRKIEDHVDLVMRVFTDQDVISYQELDSIDDPDLYDEDDVVEIFIRANSGGTRLGKSDLLFSLLAASWEEADSGMEELLHKLNASGFQYTRDFVLKTCLTLLDQGARYEVHKFRQPGVREKIEERWKDISSAICDVHDFVQGKTFIRCDKAIPSYLALIPIIYLRYRFRSAWDEAREIETFLLRSLLAGAFSGQPDQLIDDCVAKLRELQRFDVAEIFGVIRSKGRSLELTDARFWSMGYGSDSVHLIFNLWYREFNYVPAFESNLPQIDHIFPKSVLRRVKKENPETGRRDLMRYREADRNQLANCMLLTAQENGAGGKGDTPPKEWFSGKPKEYLALHLIPPDPKLWEIERFEDFVRARKDLIRAKFQYLLVAPAPGVDWASEP